jgi:hypothetical protein
MDEQSPPLDKVVIITRIEHLILNLYNDPEMIFEDICQLINKHKISEMPDHMRYFYEVLYLKGYPEYAEKFAIRYAIPRMENS